MASRLFRAVVGFGIGLGAASAACFGNTEGSTVGGVTEDATDKDASSSARVPGKTASYEDPNETDPPEETSPDDASPDVKKVADAGVDAPKDVGADAFCDAAWPTTKGNPKPPACTDPNGECAAADAGAQGRCIPLDDAGACDWTVFTTSAQLCVNKEWRCLPGTMSWDQCQ